MATFDWIEGFEEQVLSELQFGAGDSNGVWDTLVNEASISFVAGRTGGSALHIDDSSAALATNAAKWVTPGQQRVFSGYFRLAAAPSVASFIWTIFDTAGSQMARLRINTDGTLTVGCVDGTGRTTAASVSDNAWHRIDLHLDSVAGSGTWVVHWYIDGVTQTDATSAGGKVATDSQRVSLGSATATHTAVVDWDDIVASATAADFPVGEHHVTTMSPTQDRLHNAGANIIEDQVGNDIGATEAWPLLDELPPTTTNYVRQNAAGSGNYAEVIFDDDPNAAGEVIAGVMAFVALFASTNTAETGNPTTRIVDNFDATVVDVFSGDQSDTTLRYNSAIVPVPVGGWTNAYFNILKARVGFRSDAVGGHPRWAALWLAVAILEPTTVTETHTTTAIISVRSTKTHTSDARIASPVTSKSHTTTAIIRKTLTRTHTTDAQIAGGPARRENTFEGGANGVAITTGNSGGLSVDAFQNILIGVGSTLTYDSTTAGHGNVSARIVPSTTLCYCGYTTGIGTQPIIYGRLYFRLESALPVNAIDVARSLVSGTLTCSRVTVTPTGQIAILDSAGVQQAITPNTVAGRVVVGSWARIEWRMVGHATTGEVEVKLFLTPTSTTPDATISATNLNTAGESLVYRAGKTNTTVAAESTFNIDEVVWDTAGYPGPKADRFTEVHSTNAIIKATLIRTHLTTAIIRKVATVAHTSDARVLSAPSLTHTTDAILQAAGSLTHTSDALVYLLGGLSHQSDAQIAGGFTPGANAWVVVDVAADKLSGPVPEPIVSDTIGSVFIRETTVTVGSRRLSRYYCWAGLNPPARTINVTFGGDVMENILVEVTQIQGVGADDPFVTTASANPTLTQTDVTVSMPTFATDANVALISAVHPVDEDSTEEAGFFELADLSEPDLAMATAWSDNPDNTPTYSWATTTTGILAIASEIKVHGVGYVFHTNDAIIKAVLRKTHTSDASIFKTIPLSFTSDAIIQSNELSVSHTSDAMVISPLVLTQRADAVISKTLTRSHLTTAWLIPEGEEPPPPSLFPIYRVVLAEHPRAPILGGMIIDDVLTQTGIFENFQLTYEDELNEPGRCEFALPIDHELVTRGFFAVGEREIHVYRGEDELVWAGTLQVAQVNGWEVRFQATGWYDILRRRTVKQDYSSRFLFDPQLGWSYIDQFKVVRELINMMNLEDNTGITNYDDTVMSGVVRRLTICSEERRLVSDVIEDFAAAINGFDFACLPDKRFRMWFPRRDSGSPVMSVDGTASLSNISYSIDAADLVTQVSGVGPQEECRVPDVDMQPVNPLADPLVARYGILDGTVDLKENQDEEHRQAIITEALQEGSKLRFQPDITLQTLLPDAPSPQTYGIGDIVSVSCSRGAPGGFGDFTLTGRILKRRVQVTAPGFETVTITVDVESVT